MSAIGSGVPLDDGPWLKSVYSLGAAPCGSCRQFLWEFAVPNAIVIVDQSFGRLKRVAYLRELFPEPFGPRDLKVDRRPGTPPKGLTPD